MPFRNGQWIDNGDFDLVGKFRDGYDGAMKRGALGDARDAYDAGNYDEAARFAAPYDSQQAGVYRDEGTRAYQRSYADAYGSQDFDGALNAARMRGDLQGVQAARTGRNNAEFASKQKAAMTFLQELRTADNAPPESRNEVYRGTLARALTQADERGSAFLTQFMEQNPEWSANASQMLQQSLLQAARAYGTADPEAYINNFVKEQELALNERKTGIAERNAASGELRAEAAQTTAQAALTRAENPSSNRASWRPMSPEELSANNLPPGTSALIDDDTGNVKTLRSQRQYTDGASAAAGFAARMRAATIELRRAEQAAGFKIEDTLNPMTLNPAAQRWLGAARDLINAQLRRESGAAIGRDEFSSARQQYLPNPLDWGNRGAREAKYNRLNGMFRAMREQSQGAYDEWYGEPGSTENPIIGADGMPVANQLGPTPGAPPPRPRNVPPTAKWDPAANSGRGMWVM